MSKESKKTNNIVFYEMWYDAILQQPEEIQPQLLMAVMNYAFYGIEPEDANVKMALSFITQKNRLLVLRRI